jgi:hypothetical protein
MKEALSSSETSVVTRGTSQKTPFFMFLSTFTSYFLKIMDDTQSPKSQQSWVPFICLLHCFQNTLCPTYHLRFSAQWVQQLFPRAHTNSATSIWSIPFFLLQTLLIL